MTSMVARPGDGLGAGERGGAAGRPAVVPAPEVDRGIAELEGYLLARSAIDEAWARASAFAGRLPWLTGEQRRQVESLYAREHLDHTRRSLERTSRRAVELRTEYQQRYDRLRIRCTALFFGAVAAASGALTVLGVAARG